ncbi:phosphate transport system regulatory protein PhoU [Lentzea sp. PSKA42]|uniref:Phosphate transport system regulatory protein PhoU n=1 Tax=Lentzea indica TaxID=2604800 RepID=A0ABX1F9R8_9PSEU|nr:PhoU domain-containing protein [Lentzea indica]NKE55466.1 phosphate transport system regulatory protein PhoU [Lentzea indica]
MRESFHGDLAKLGEQLAHMCVLAAESMRRANRALLTADLELAEQVLSVDAELDKAREECETRAQSLLALQAPVARDLRTILAAVYCAEKIERMGDLAAHVADTARFTHPDRAVPVELESAFTEMGAVAAGMADRLAEQITSDAVDAFAELDDRDQAIDALHAEVLGLITEAACRSGSPHWSPRSTPWRVSIR